MFLDFSNKGLVMFNLQNISKPEDDHQVKSLIKTILSDHSSYNTSLNYAVSYCREALTMSGGDLKVQVIYILNNISRWRHPESKRVRESLKLFIKD